MDTPSEPRADAAPPPPRDPLEASDALRFVYDMAPAMTRMRRALYLAGAACVALFLLPQLLGHMPQVGPAVLVAFYTGCATAFALVTGWRGWRRDARALVAIADGALHVPSLAHWRGRRRVALGDLRNVTLAPVSGRPTLFAAVAGGAPLVLALDGFEGEDDARRFVDALRFRGRARVREIAVDFGLTRLTFVVCGGLVALHLLRELLGHIDVSALIAWGGLVRTLVVEGQWYRVFTYAALQPNALALALQVIAFAVLLPGMQRSLGLARVLLVMLGAAAIGGLAVLGWIEGEVAFGAEGALYGLLGALAWLRIADREHIAPTVWRLPAWLWVGFLCVDILGALITPGPGWSLRSMGFMCGLAIAALTEWLDTRVRGVCTWASLAVLGTACVASIHALIDRTEPVIAEPLRIVESPRAGLNDVNLGAWIIATSYNVGALELQRARDAMQARLASAPGAPGAVRDTLATLHYRLGDYVRALEIESAVQRESPDAVYASQIWRFAHAAGVAAREGEVVAEFEGDRVCVASPGGALLDVDVALVANERVEGILQFERVADRACANVKAYAAKGTVIEVGRVVKSAHPGNGRASYWRADPQIFALP